MKITVKILILLFALTVFSGAAAYAAKESNSKSGANSDKAEAYAEEVLKKIKDETITDEEKEKMLDKLKKMIDKADNDINKKRFEIQKIEEEIKPIEAQKASLCAALDELISFAPRAFKNANDNGTGDDKDSKGKKSKKDKKESKSKKQTK